jgi:hypothetical protein
MDLIERLSPQLMDTLLLQAGAGFTPFPPEDFALVGRSLDDRSGC